MKKLLMFTVLVFCCSANAKMMCADSWSIGEAKLEISKPREMQVNETITHVFTYYDQKIVCMNKVLSDGIVTGCGVEGTKFMFLSNSKFPNSQNIYESSVTTLPPVTEKNMYYSFACIKL